MRSDIRFSPINKDNNNNIYSAIVLNDNRQDAHRKEKAKSASHAGRRGPRPTQRPYTPQHSNIAATSISSSDKY